MSYDEFKQLCRKSWEDEKNYRCFDRSKQRYQEVHRIRNESKNSYIQYTPETKAF